MSKQQVSRETVGRARRARRSGSSARAAWRVWGWVAAAGLWTLPFSLVPVGVGVGVAVAAYGSWVGDPVRVVLCAAVLVSLQLGGSYLRGVHWAPGSRKLRLGGVVSADRPGLGVLGSRAAVVVGAAWWGAACVAGVWLTVLTGSWWVLPGAALVGAVWWTVGNPHHQLPFGLGVLLAFGVLGVGATVAAATIVLGQVTWEGWCAAAITGTLIGSAVTITQLETTPSPATPTEAAGSPSLSRRGSRVVACVLLLAAFVGLGVVTAEYPVAGYGFCVLLAAGPACLITLLGRAAAEFRIARRLVSLTTLFLGVTLLIAYIA
jgi:1,4-dihydroxy-2-naphthoate octaprenyltransferase